MPQAHALQTASCESPPLAVWAIPDLHNDDVPLPAQLCRRLIAHYTDPGDLVLTPTDQTTLAARFERRALPLEPLLAASTAVAGSLRRLPPLAAQLALLPPISADAATPVGRIAELLAPGGFLVVPAPARRPALAETIDCCRQAGVRYWQHLVAFDPDGLERRSGRCHRDLLVFRQSLPAAAAAAAAAERVAA